VRAFGVFGVAVLALAVGMSACGGAGGREPEAWVEDMCSTMETWLERTNEDEEELRKAIEAAEIPSEARAAFVAHMQSGARAATEALRRLEAAGAPAVEDGKKVASTLVELMDGIHQVFVDGIPQARRVPVSDWESYNRAAGELLIDVQTQAADVIQELADTTVSSAQELDDLFRIETECSQAQGAVSELAADREARARTIVEDDFSAANCDADWQTRRFSGRDAKLDCMDGFFRIEVTDPAVHQFAVVALPAPQPALSVDVDAVPRKESGTSYGVGCWDARERGYLLYLVGGKRYAIFKQVDAARPTQTVKTGRLPDDVLNSGVPNRIHGECDTRQAGTVLTLSVNDHQVTRLGADDIDALSVGGFAMTTDRPPASTDFDNLLVSIP
jgi:hypothetical protein